MGREDPLEKGMAAQTSILAWEIPWTEKPGGLQSRGRKESDTTEKLTYTHTHTHKKTQTHLAVSKLLPKYWWS